MGELGGLGKGVINILTPSTPRPRDDGYMTFCCLFQNGLSVERLDERNDRPVVEEGGNGGKGGGR